ncbi:hypothetical protein AGRA3207_000165 [Actinomadura graeca]|uniref:Uncharacterized protein n=1 Tax=Actinomadura graeca TaxID=2750812 RepID=A0ABX8QLV1_9ACTN|nr:hypothetical protein [Actinomadura graeca]QXJ19603.1 hypothetical protein AGRA3207_000165 [Actinomadura graeca]
MGQTPNYQLPYPGLADPPNVPLHAQQLAEAVDTNLKTANDRVGGLSTDVTNLSTRMTRAEMVLRGNVKVVDLNPTRIVNSTEMSEVVAMAQTLTIPTAPPAHATYYLINVEMHVATNKHGDMRLGAKLAGQDLWYFGFRPVGLLNDASALVTATYPVELARYSPGDYPLTYWVRNGISGVTSEIHSAVLWTAMA